MKAWLTEHRHAIADTFARLGRQPLSVLLNILVVGIALALPLGGFTILKSLQPVTGRLASEPEISVFLALDAKRAESEALGPRLRALPGVSRAEFVSRDTALAKLKEQAGMSDVMAALNQNPLPDAWVLHLAPAAERVQDGASGANAAAAQEALATQIRALPRVEFVQIDSAWVRRMEALVRFLSLALTILAGALGVAVVAVFFNTIRLQVLTQREEIEVAKLIGATDSYIRRPFYYMGALQGVAGGLLALGLVVVALWPLNAALGDFARLYTSEFRFQVLPAPEVLAFLGLTAALGWIGALLSVSRHLSGLAR